MTSSAASHLDPAEVRRLVALGKERGLILEPGKVRAVEKNGTPVAAGDGLNSQWMDVTPELALRWLANNVRNRTLSDDVVLAYARDMKNGEWQPTHQGLAFNDRDELIDGQHRLHAIARSGCTIRMMVTFGLPSVVAGKELTTMDCVDRGRTRSVSDQLKIQHGLKDGGIIAAVSLSIGRLCFMERTRRLSVGQTLEIYRAFEEPIKHVIRHRSKEHGLKAAGVLAAFAFALAVDVRLKAMFHRLNHGEDLLPGSPMAHLRAFLVSDDAKLLNRGSDRALAELVLEAIHLEIFGKPIQQLELSTDGVEHFRKQQPERVAKIAELFRLPT
jgi:hypothetical protein